MGAYKQFQPAYDLARKVVNKLPGVLSGGFIKVVPLRKRNRRPLYRSRIHGLDKGQAYQACERLKHLDIDCMEVRLKDVQVASSN